MQAPSCAWVRSASSRRLRILSYRSAISITAVTLTMAGQCSYHVANPKFLLGAASPVILLLDFNLVTGDTYSKLSIISDSGLISVKLLLKRSSKISRQISRIGSLLFPLSNRRITHFTRSCTASRPSYSDVILVRLLLAVRKICANPHISSSLS